jgi:hypothetical protein
VTTIPNPPGGHTAYGITLHNLTDEDGIIDTVVAFGHQDKRQFVAACNHLARTDWGVKNLANERGFPWAEAEARVRHEYADYRPEGNNRWRDWYARIGPNGPGRVPVTVWTT